MFSEIKNYIENSSNIVILPHKNADGDCLGSSYALKLALEAMGKRAYVLEEDENNDRIKKNVCTGDNTSFDADLAISVDCGDESRLGTRCDFYFSHDKKISIDHHDTNTFYGDVNFVDGKAAAAGEIIYRLLQFMNISITKEIATNLYIAIVSDTGGFAYSNTTADTMKIAGELLNFDIHHNDICAYLFDTNTYGSLKLMGIALNSLKTYCGGKLAVVAVTKDDIAKSGATTEEAGMLVNLARSLDTAEVGISLREVDEGTKVSFRSKSVDISPIAVKYGGGGHKMAAACVMSLSLSEAEKLLAQDLEKVFLEG